MGGIDGIIRVVRLASQETKGARAVKGAVTSAEISCDAAQVAWAASKADTLALGLRNIQQEYKTSLSLTQATAKVVDAKLIANEATLVRDGFKELQQAYWAAERKIRLDTLAAQRRGESIKKYADAYRKLTDAWKHLSSCQRALSAAPAGPLREAAMIEVTNAENVVGEALAALGAA